MTKIISILLTVLVLSLVKVSAKQFTVNMNDCTNITYIDTDNDATFDTLIIDECGTITTLKLRTSATVGKPALVDYANSTLEIALKNYNNVRKDAYFQVRVWNNDTLIGYWEHIMGSHNLNWKPINNSYQQASPLTRGLGVSKDMSLRGAERRGNLKQSRSQ